MDARRKITIVVEIRDHACLFAVTPLRWIIPRLPGFRDGIRPAVTGDFDGKRERRPGENCSAPRSAYCVRGSFSLSADGGRRNGGCELFTIPAGRSSSPGR